MSFGAKSSRRVSAKRRSSGSLWNLLTALVLVATAAVIALFAVIYLFPNSFLNPFPPVNVPQALVLPTSTPTSILVLGPTWTPRATQLPTDTPQPTASAIPSMTPTLLVLPSATLTPTPTATKPPFYKITSSSPDYMASAGRSCAWMGVGGTVVDLNDLPVTGLRVLLGGAYEGVNLAASSITGSALSYGESGYELFIANDPGVSKKTIFVQLQDASGKNLSDKVYFETYDDCKTNLIRIDFEQTQ